MNFVIETGTKCNNNCIFCSVAGIKKELSTVKIINIINNLKKKRVKKIQFCGGEPSIRKDLKNLINYSKKLDFKTIGITTNARIFCYENKALEIIKAGCNYFAVSIHGHNSKIHNACTRTPNSFEQSIKGLKNLLKYKNKNIHIKINLLLNSINIKFIEEIIFWINETFKNLDLITLINMQPIGNASKNKSLIFKLTEFKNNINNAIKKSKIPIQIFDIPLCILEDKNYGIKKGGYILSSKGNSIKNFNTSMDSYIKKLNICRFCDLNKECSGVWKEYIKKFGDKEFVPIIKEKKSIYLEITKKCNQRCLFCVKSINYFNEENQDINDIKKILNSINKNTSVIFDGGEPTLNENILELISICKNKKIKNLTILTNGVKLSNEQFVKDIHKNTTEEMKISFSVSLHSHIKEISEKLTNSKKTFEKTIKGINNLKKYNFPFSVYIVMNKFNIYTLPNLVRFIINNGAIGITFAYPWPSGELSLARKNPDIFFKISDNKEKIIEAIKICKDKNILINWAGCGIIPFCMIPEINDILIKSICVETDSKFVANDDGGIDKFKLLSKNYANYEKHKKKGCKKCKYDKICHGIWNYYINLFGDKELIPIYDFSTEAKLPDILKV